MSSTETRNQLVTFHLSSELYGIDIMDVREIVPLQDVRTIPNAPEYVEGIINLRGEIVLIINLHNRFNLDRMENEEDDSLLGGFLIIELGRQKLGVRIDRISRVVTIENDDIREPPKMLSGIGREYIQGVTNDNDRYLIILDIQRLFDPAEIKQLGTIAD